MKSNVRSEELKFLAPASSFSSLVDIAASVCFCKQSWDAFDVCILSANDWVGIFLSNSGGISVF